MSNLTPTQVSAAGFGTVAEAEQAIAALQSAGVPKEQLFVICSATYQDQLRNRVSNIESPSPPSSEMLATGGVAGAVLGGIALAATVAAGGPIGAAAALVGGGAIAGGFGNLVMSKGYENEADDRFKKAVEMGVIVVGVHLDGTFGRERTEDVWKVLQDNGGRELTP